MKSFILVIALASGAWLSGGATADATDVHFVRGGRHGHHYGHHRGHHHGYRGYHHGRHYHHGHHGHFYGGYPHYGGAYYRAPYYNSPYAWQTPYYGFRLYGPTFSFGYYGY
jgi:hypothetical protein